MILRLFFHALILIMVINTYFSEQYYMNLSKFKHYLSNIVSGSLFEHLHPYEDSLYSKDAHFEVSPLNMPTHTKHEMNLYRAAYKEQQDLVDSLSKSPQEEDVLNGEFSFIIKFDSLSIGTGLSLANLNKIAKKLHTDLLFVNGDGNDYQLSEYTGGHDSEVILHIQFKGNQHELLNDYKNWYAQREVYLKEKIEAKQAKIKHKKV